MERGPVGAEGNGLGSRLVLIDLTALHQPLQLREICLSWISRLGAPVTATQLSRSVMTAILPAVRPMVSHNWPANSDTPP